MDVEQARFNMVEQQIRPWEVLDPAVLDLLFTVRREEFVPSAYRALAFGDLEIPIGEGESMWAPRLEARALQELAPKRGETVLEIGTGSGYLTACLAALARDVVSLERHADLADAARARLQAQGIANVRIETADAYVWDSDRQFDAICVGGAVEAIPARFLRWLRPGGRMFIVHGHAPAMEAALVRPADGTAGFAIESLFETELPYLAGGAPAPRFHL